MKARLFVLSAVLALFSASAATITFNDLTDTVTITTDVPGPFSGACESEAACSIDGNLLNSDGVNSVTFTNFNIYEPNGIDLSDTLIVLTASNEFNVNGHPIFSALFSSDSEGGTPLSPLGSATTVIETGTTMNVFTAGGVTFQVASDLEASPTPEPSTMTLLGVGCSLLGFFWRKRSN